MAFNSFGAFNITKKYEKHYGQKWGMWTIQPVPVMRQNSNLYFMCKCECGTERRVQVQSLFSGDSQSCGCGTGALRGAGCKLTSSIHDGDGILTIK